MPRSQVYKYTPGQASTEELEATFVGRERLLGQLLVRLREWADGAPAEHTLLVGPRGMGKTHLLRLLGHRLARARFAAPVHVLLFPEESYTIGSAEDLLRDMWARVGPGAPAPTGAWAMDQFRSLHSQDGSRFVVLLDGLDLLLDQLRESDEGKLHELMTTESHLCFIATAAQMPAALTEYDRPLYHLMRPEPLRPLDASQAAELLYARAKWANNTRFAQSSRALTVRISALSELAGGNPRLLLMLYQSLEPGELPSVIESFRALLDELTPFFKHVVESRAPQQRKLLMLAAFHDRGAAPSELAKESGLPERQVSALLGPLVKDGLLKRARRPGARSSAYPFAEPLLRMWLQMRASPEGERRLACIVEFFRLWYESAEAEYRQVFADQLRAASHLLERGRLEDWREAMFGLRYLAGGAPDEDSAWGTVDPLLDFLRTHPGLSEPDLKHTLETLADSLDRYLELHPDQPGVLALRGSVKVELHRAEEGLEDMDRAVALLADNPTIAILRGRMLLRLSLPAEALVDLTRALALQPDDRDALYERARAQARIGDYAAALADLDRVLTLHPGDAEASQERGSVLSGMDQWDEAAIEYGRAEELEPNNPHLPMLKAIAMMGAGQSAEALTALDSLAELGRDDVDFLIVRGMALVELGRPANALSDFDSALAREPNHPRLGNQRGLALLALERNSEAVAEFARVLERESENHNARFNHGLALAAMGQREAALRELEASARYMDRVSMVLPLATSRTAELAVNAAAAGDRGQATRALAVLVTLLKKAAPDRRGEVAFDALKVLFRSGDRLLCEEALDQLEPMFDDPGVAAPFRRSLDFLKGGRDPYFLESLNPDLRRAVELIAGEFGAESTS